MSVEWQVPDEGGRSRSGVRWILPVAALVVAIAVGAYIVLGRGTGDALAEGGGLGSQLQADDNPAAQAGAEGTEAAPSEPGAVVTGTPSESASPHSSVEEDMAEQELIEEASQVFDASYVTGIAAAVSHEVFPDGEAENVVLARDTPTGDALAAGSLVGLFDTTLLLTDSKELSPITAAEIDRLGNPRVHILGGPAAVSPEIEEQLQEAGHNVHRHAGPMQAQTAADIAGAHFPDAQTAVLVRTPERESGAVAALSSALAATGLAAAQDLPVLLTDGDSLTNATEAYLEGSLIQRIIVVGSEEEMTSNVTSRIRELGVDWIRWAGDNRFSTAVEVARNRGFQSLDDADVVILVEGGHDSVWPAGFLGTVIAAHQNGPVLLTEGTALPQATAEYLSMATPGSVEIVCTPGVTREACAAAVSALGSGSSG